MRKGFFIKPDDVLTPVHDKVSATIPDQSIGLRELMLKFAYIGNERLEDIINRGFDGDEDEDILGVDAGALDYAEVHDRLLDYHRQSTARAVHQVDSGLAEVTPDSMSPENPPAPATAPAPDGDK